MTDSIDNKSKEKHDNLEVDLDAVPDEAESSLFSMNEFQDDEEAIDRLLMNSDFDADDAPGQASVEEDSALNEFTDFSDFSDFNEPEMVRQDSPRTAAVEDEEAEQVTGNSSAVVADEVDDFFGLGDDFSESKLIQDDEVGATVPTVADLIAANEEQQGVVEESDVGEDAAAPEDSDDFSDFSDFNEPEMVRQDSPRTAAVEDEEAEQVTENLSAYVDDADPAGEVDDFSGLSDDLNEADMIQDDEAEISADLAEQSFDDEDAIDSLFPDTGFDSEDALENTDGKADELLDDFDEPDMIQDEVDDWADLVAYSEEPQVAVESLANDLQDDENNNSLLLDADFDAGDALEQRVGPKDEFGDDEDLIEADDFFQLDQVSDDFSRQTEAVQLAETEELSTQDDHEDDFLLPDFDITADTEISDVGGDTGIKEDDFGNIDFLNEEEDFDVFGSEAEEPKAGGSEAIVESELKQSSATDTVINAKENIEDVKLNPFGFEQEDIKKQLEDAENKVKKAKLLSYAAVGFGVVALIAAAGLGVMIFSAKTEISKLTEAVSTLETSLARSAANSPNEEIDAMRNSVVQLNQQIDGFITELKGNPLYPVDLLNNKVPNIVAKQDMVSKSLDMLQVKMGGLEEKASSKPTVAEPPKVEVAHEPAPAQENNIHGIAPAKIETAHEPIKESVAHEPVLTKAGAVPEHAPTQERAMHEAASAKVEAVPETAPAKVKTQPKVAAVKPKVPAKAISKQEPVKEKIPAVPGKWGINLVAFKQEWFAKSKVAEFAQQGVFAEVFPVHERNTTMYRLRVGGFKSKAEADSNTARIKKALNLDSVWVSDN